MKNEKCFECGGRLRKSTSYKVFDVNLGPVEVEGECWHCPKCHCDYVSVETITRWQNEWKRLMWTLLWTRAGGSKGFDEQFMTTKELSEFLGVSVQKISHNQSFKQNIYNLELDWKTYWLKESAMAYKETGDGRINLRKTASCV